MENIKTGMNSNQIPKYQHMIISLRELLLCGCVIYCLLLLSPALRVCHQQRSIEVVDVMGDGVDGVVVDALNSVTPC